MDPWSWTVDEVVRNLCHLRDLWKDRPNASLPDPEFLEQQLRDNAVDGATLLQDITKETLKDDFGIKKLGERSAIMHAVTVLRTQSQGYVSHRSNLETNEQDVKNAVLFASPTNAPSIQTLAVIPPVNPDVVSLSNSQPIPQLRQGETLVTADKGGRKRRRLQPTIVKSSTKTTVEEAGENQYLLRRGVPLDQSFYGDLENGQLLLTDDEDDFEFYRAQTYPLGHKRSLQKRMQHYLQASVEKLDDKRYAIYPYPQRLITKGKGRSITLMKVENNGAVSATKRDAVMLDSREAGEQDIDNNHDWDFLAKWSKGETTEDILPAYGESGSENDFSVDLIKEIEEEVLEREASKTNGILDEEAVNDAIRQAIEMMEAKWHTVKEPKREEGAYRVWRKGQGRRGTLAKDTVKYELRHLDTVLSNLRKAIGDEVWMKTEQVVKQCACMELSIFNKLDLEWKLKLWQRQQAPPRQPPALRLANTIPRKDLEEDVESLESESDHLADFIDIDGDFRMMDGSESPYLSAREEPFGEATPSPPPKLPEYDRNTSVSLVDGPRSSPLPDILEMMSPAVTPHVPFEGQARLHSDVTNSYDTFLSTPVGRESPGSRYPTLIDLTGSSPPPQSPLLEARAPEVPYGDDPENSKNEEVAAWDWDMLESSPDRKRLIMKLFLEMNTAQRAGILESINGLNVAMLIFEIKHGLKGLEVGLKHLPGKSPADYLVTVNLARLFTCWYYGKRAYWSSDIGHQDINEILNAEDADEDMEGFLVFSKRLVQKSDLFDAEEGNMPRKKRRKLVPKSEKTRGLQEDAHMRQQEEKDRISQNMAHLGSSFQAEGDQGTPGIPINPGKRAEDEFVFINRHIAPSLKPYQIEGVRFLWREILNLDEGRQGCLLAHTMGLGKTLQTITLLATIADAANSPNPKIVALIPEALRKSQTLILCPVALIDNWRKEFDMWLPEDHHLGTVFKLLNDESTGSGAARTQKRLDTIRDWWRHGGVLIIGYELFRILVSDNKKEAQDPSHLRMKKYLLKSPSIVIADEAHKLKNPESGIGKAVRELTTRSRIALTGSPLANNLGDYYHMIDWVAESYLGKVDEFRAQYALPIEAGFYLDSTRYDQRQSLIKLQALMADIDPKVQRADISVLKGTLKSKTEFVIEVPLTKIQRQLYVGFVQALKAQELAAIASGKLLDWLALLHLLCCQPALFLAKLTERDTKAKVGKDKAVTEKEDVATEAGPSALESISKNALDRLRQLFKDVISHGGDADAVEFSHKASIIKEIVFQSQRVNDKVLLFSHHLPVLDYFEKLFKQEHIKAQRLDGGTSAGERISRIRKFQNNEYDVFLISTKAGGLGLNLPAANRVILVDFGFNPTWEEQAIGRAYRIGQTKPVFVYHLITQGTFEGPLRQRTIFKQQLAFRTIDRKDIVSAAEKSEKMYLFEPLDVERQDTTAFFGKDPKVLDFVLQSTAGKEIRTLSTTETLQVESQDKLTAEELKAVEQMKADDRLRRTDIKAWHAKNNRRELWHERQAAEAEAKHQKTLQEEQMRLLAGHKQNMQQSLSDRVLQENNLAVRTVPETTPGIPKTTQAGSHSSTTPKADDEMRSKADMPTAIEMRGGESVSSWQVNGFSRALPASSRRVST